MLKKTSSFSFSLSSSMPTTTNFTEELESLFNKFDIDKICSLELGSMMKGDTCNLRHELVELNTKGVDLDEVLANLKDTFPIFNVNDKNSIAIEELYIVMANLDDLR
ncbi:hypothetical protein Fmac_027253 [Flemingia macrophylla]|uniref:Uncharacterized protein n=1 Tax=Flemingia macrophylla TaxID=520843 RepID=A0ABD1LH64_9FABA